jgi:hypothetical protein
MSLEYLMQVRQNRERLSLALQSYREKFDSEPDFGPGKFPKKEAMSSYVSEIAKAIKTSRPIRSKHTGLITTDID